MPVLPKRVHKQRAVGTHCSCAHRIRGKEGLLGLVFGVEVPEYVVALARAGLQELFALRAEPQSRDRKQNMLLDRQSLVLVDLVGLKGIDCGGLAHTSLGVLTLKFIDPAASVEGPRRLLLALRRDRNCVDLRARAQLAVPVIQRSYSLYHIVDIGNHDFLLRAACNEYGVVKRGGEYILFSLELQGLVVSDLPKAEALIESRG